MIWSQSQGGGSIRSQAGDLDIMQQRLLEQDLNFQLHMLVDVEKRAQQTSLFSTNPASSMVYPNTTKMEPTFGGSNGSENTATSSTSMSITDFFSNWDGSTLEGLALCAVIGAIVLGPK